MERSWKWEAPGLLKVQSSVVFKQDYGKPAKSPDEPIHLSHEILFFFLNVTKDYVTIFWRNFISESRVRTESQPQLIRKKEKTAFNSPGRSEVRLKGCTRELEGQLLVILGMAASPSHNAALIPRQVQGKLWTHPTRSHH